MANTIDVIIRLAKTGTGASDAAKELEGVKTQAQATVERLDAMSSRMLRAGAGLSIGVTAPMVMLGRAAIKAASDLNESQNKVNVVFGTSATAVQKWAVSSEAALLMSKTQALDAAGAFGAMFTSMGLGQAETLAMSEGLVNLAADLSSFYNIATGDALEKLRSGIAGEAEPLRVLGVNLLEANVQQQAYSMGLATQGAQLTEQQRVLARYALIMQQTKVAQGDAANTMGGFANQTRALEKNFANLSAELGANLLPAAIKVVAALNSMAVAFASLSPGMQTAVVNFALVAAAIGPVTTAGGALLKVISAIIAAGPAIASVATTVATAAAGPALIAGGAVVAAAVLTPTTRGPEEQQEFRERQLMATSQALARAKSILAEVTYTNDAATIAEAQSAVKAAQAQYDLARGIEAVTAAGPQQWDFLNRAAMGYDKLAEAAQNAGRQASYYRYVERMEFSSDVGTGARGYKPQTGMNAADYAAAAAMNAANVTGQSMSVSETLARAQQAESQKVVAAQTAAQRIAAAFDNLASSISSKIGDAIGAAKGLLDLTGGKGGIFAPGANGPFEDIYRTLDVAKLGAQSPWYGKEGVSQEQAKEIGKQFEMGNLFAPGVAEKINWPQLAEAAMAEMQTQNLQKYAGEAAAALIAKGGPGAVTAESMKAMVDELAAKNDLVPNLQQITTAVATLGGGGTLGAVVDAIGKINFGTNGAAGGTNVTVNMGAGSVQVSGGTDKAGTQAAVAKAINDTFTFMAQALQRSPSTAAAGLAGNP